MYVNVSPHSFDVFEYRQVVRREDGQEPASGCGINDFLCLEAAGLLQGGGGAPASAAAAAAAVAAVREDTGMADALKRRRATLTQQWTWRRQK